MEEKINTCDRPDIVNDPTLTEERLKEVMRLVNHYEEAIRRCDINIERQRNMTPATYKDPVTESLKRAVESGKFDSDDPKKSRWNYVKLTEAKIKKRVKDNINHAIHNVSQSRHRAELNSFRFANTPPAHPLKLEPTRTPKKERKKDLKGRQEE